LDKVLNGFYILPRKKKTPHQGAHLLNEKFYIARQTLQGLNLRWAQHPMNK
jgi:hypothetical protein